MSAVLRRSLLIGSALVAGVGAAAAAGACRGAASGAGAGGWMCTPRVPMGRRRRRCCRAAVSGACKACSSMFAA